MTQEEQLKAFEQALEEAWKQYGESGAATVDALEENTQELAFAKGFNAGYTDGYKDTIEKVCGYIKNNHADIFIRYIRGYEADDEIELLKNFMEGKQ